MYLHFGSFCHDSLYIYIYTYHNQDEVATRDAYKDNIFAQGNMAQVPCNFSFPELRYYG